MLKVISKKARSTKYHCTKGGHEFWAMDVHPELPKWVCVNCEMARDREREPLAEDRILRL